MKLGTHKKLAATGRVGTFGCSAGDREGARVVRVALAAAVKKPPRTAVVDCPVCGQRHIVRPTWRQPTERDEGREPDLVIGADR